MPVVVSILPHVLMICICNTYVTFTCRFFYGGNYKSCIQKFAEVKPEPPNLCWCKVHSMNHMVFQDDSQFCMRHRIKLIPRLNLHYHLIVVTRLAELHFVCNQYLGHKNFQLLCCLPFDGGRGKERGVSGGGE